MPINDFNGLFDRISNDLAASISGFMGKRQGQGGYGTGRGVDYDALLRGQSNSVQRAMSYRPDAPITAPKAPSAPGMSDFGPGPAAQAPGPTGTTAPTSMIDRSSREAFIRSMRPYAQLASQQTGLPASYFIAINLNEQGWQYDAPGNNYFGIKADPWWKGQTTGPVQTWESVNGQPQQTTGTFRAYADPSESYVDFVDFLRKNPRYAEAVGMMGQGASGADIIRAIHRAGYATDPLWSDKIIGIASELDAMDLDARYREALGD